MGPSSNANAWLQFASLPREQGGLGLQQHQAAGLVGNLVKESGPNLSPWGVTGDNGTAFGTAQWRGDRFNALRQFAASKGMDFRTMPAQQAFMRHEFDGSENRAYRALTSASTPEAAATAVNKFYERSADNTGGRERAARELMMQFGGSEIRPTAGATQAMPFDTTPPPDDGFLGQLGLRSDFMTGANGGYGLAGRLGRAGAALMAIDNPAGAHTMNTGMDNQAMLELRRQLMAQKVQTQAPVGSDFKYDDKSGTFFRTRPDGTLETQQNPNTPAVAQANPNTVKAIIEGRAPYPANSRASDAAAIREAVNNADPTFDAVNYNARAATRKDFTSGKSAQNLTSFNTTLGHLDHLDKAIDPLNNATPSLFNRAANAISGQTDEKFQEAQKKFDMAKTAVVDELTRSFRGTGGNVHDLIEWEKSINSAESPKALHAAVLKATELLRSRIEAVGDQYNRGMGTTKDPLELLTPKSAEAYKRLLGEGSKDSGNPVEAEMRRRGLLK